MFVSLALCKGVYLLGGIGGGKNELPILLV